ncbi:MAG: hypothetical protein WC686_02050 [Candidatus Shapirobacteria bacterium]|jgi:hypothetical protein
MPEGIYDIQPLRVTCRAPESITRPFGLGEKDILNLPPKPVVVEIGSGLYQELATWIKTIRPDAVTVSIDPTLALRPSKDNPLLLNFGDGEAGDFIVYTDTESPPRELTYKALGQEPKTPVDEKDSHISLERAKNGAGIHKNRLRKSPKGGAVAAIAPAIPLASSCVDLLIDSYAAATHYCTDEERTRAYFGQITDLLKAGGQAYLFPIDSYTDFVTKMSDEDRNAKARKNVTSALSQIEGISVEYFESVVDNKYTRVGIRIYKKRPGD